MHGRNWMRQTHRWISIVFTGLSAAIFIALAMGGEPAQWLYSVPLIPLAVLVLTGLYMFFAPHAARRRPA